MTTASNDEIRILTPSGMLGYGFPVDHFKMGLAQKPHAITIDSGSTDSGPQKLGLGEMTCSREAYVKDIEVLLEAQHEARIPLLISSAGGDGTNLHVDVFRDIVSRYRPQARLALQARLDLCRHRQGPYRARAFSRPHRAAGARPAARPARGRCGDRRRGADGRRAVRQGARRKRRRRRRAGRPLLRSLADRGDGDPRRLRSGARLAHGQDHGMRRALRRTGRPQRHGLPAARPLRDRAAQSRRALHHGLGGRPHALRKDPSLPAGRPRRHARSFQLQVRAGDRPARARIGQPLRARQALHGEARGGQDLGLAQHLHRRRARSDLHRPDRRDPRPRCWPARAPTSPKCRRRATASFPISTARTA